MKCLFGLLLEFLKGLKKGFFNEGRPVRNKQDAESWRYISVNGNLSFVGYDMNDNSPYLTIRILNSKKPAIYFPISHNTFTKLQHQVGCQASIQGTEFKTYDGRIYYKWEQYTIDGKSYHNFT